MITPVDEPMFTFIESGQKTACLTNREHEIDQILIFYNCTRSVVRTVYCTIVRIHKFSSIVDALLCHGTRCAPTYSLDEAEAYYTAILQDGPVSVLDINCLPCHDRPSIIIDENRTFLELICCPRICVRQKIGRNCYILSSTPSLHDVAVFLPSCSGGWTYVPFKAINLKHWVPLGAPGE